MCITILDIGCNQDLNYIALDIKLEKKCDDSNMAVIAFYPLGDALRRRLITIP